MEKLAARNIDQAIAGKRIIERQRINGRPVLLIVKFSEFVGEMKAAGIHYPTDYITLALWVKTIADRVMPKHTRRFKRWLNLRNKPSCFNLPSTPDTRPAKSTA